APTSAPSLPSSQVTVPSVPVLGNFILDPGNLPASYAPDSPKLFSPSARPNPSNPYIPSGEASGGGYTVSQNLSQGVPPQTVVQPPQTVVQPPTYTVSDPTGGALPGGEDWQTTASWVANTARAMYS